MTDRDPTAGRRAPGPALRLICVVDGDEVRVVSTRRLTKVVPASEDLPGRHAGGRPPSGFWVEVRDGDEQVRYRRVVPDPLTGESEVPGEDGSFTRRASAPGAFALLLPDLPDADHVSLVRSGPARPRGPAGGRGGPSLADRTGEVARLSLRPTGPQGGGERS